LKGARALVKRAVDTIGCHGFYQEEFPPDYRKIEEILRSSIEKCDAVIHLAGVCYGSEPGNKPSDKPRRSYAQMEYDIARELGRPLYVFVCSETFPYDPHSQESNDAAVLQVAHRHACLERQEIRETVDTIPELEKRVSQLHAHLRRLERQIVETSDSVKAVGAQVAQVQSLQRVQNEKLDNQEDRLVKSFRADLRGKLTRAQELHARDDCKQAIELLEEVYYTAKSHGLKHEQLEAALNLGFATSDKRDVKPAERRLRDAEKLIRDVKGAWHQIQYCRLKAKVLRHKKHLVPAEKALQKAISLSQGGDDHVAQVGLLAHASYIHLLCDAKRFDEADEHLIIARKVVEGSDGSHPVALIGELLEACVHWAISKGAMNDLNAFVGAGLRYGIGRDGALSIGHALLECSNGARGLRATSAAIICADAAERLGHVAQRPDLALAAAYTAAGALAEAEDFHGARERCLRLLDAAKSVNEPKLRFGVFHLLSVASRELGDKTTAVDAAEAALRNTEGEANGLCLANMTLAEALRDCGRVKEAMEHARTAHEFSEQSDLPPEWVDQNLVLLADCAARLGDWDTAESYSAQLAKRSPETPGSKGRRTMIDNRIKMHKMVRESLTSVIGTVAPLSVARTEGAVSVQTANAMLMSDVIDAWREYPKASVAIYDYWGRGNLSRVMLNMRAFPGAFNMTLEVHTVHEARQAVRLWAFIADVLILIWKGPTVSSRVMCPVPRSFSMAGGGGYFAALDRGTPLTPTEVTIFSRWKTTPSKDGATPVIFTNYASLLPEDVGKFLCEEAAPLISLGRLVVVPSTGICCVGSGHGPVESLFAEACNAMPAVRGDAARYPASYVPYFPDIPLPVLAEVVQEQEASMRGLRLLLIRKTRQFVSSGIVGSEARELELEIHDSLAKIAETQSGLRQKHGWGEAREAVASRYDGFSEQDVAPILVLQNMGYRWRVEHAIGDSAPATDFLPKSNEPIGTWLHPPGALPEFFTSEDVRKTKPTKRRKRR
jgi:tetratricopeptide (TPR) repeat protein